ncbi:MULTISPECIES: DUF6873 family GME fold protein [Caproicibacterium]|uniref:DUF6873 domain-containing protein n=1 Tax=Caproicibacterium argilliputei TaxID=3030016 RepID=A0AA97H2C6_9FIRM|nr:hypothetical protein [Caproicibacterium argilliputei]WOC31008.1 hypothetical protein PXC00_07100 [Caproicibacterium argilliputei]
MAAVSATAVQAVDALQQLGVSVVQILPSAQFAASVAAHADLQCCLMGAGEGFCANVQVQAAFQRIGIHLFQTNVHDFSTYPQDCSLNAARIGHFVFANPKCICTELQANIAERGLQLVAVRQGYAKCSIAVVSEQAIMTADTGIAEAARTVGFDVLLLKPGHIELEGYPYGFIGGACGKLSATVLAFAGTISTHPQAVEISLFLKKHGVQALSLYDGSLQDIGGILPLAETE